MKEINRRTMSTESEGVACGPVSVYAVDAEIVVEDEGHRVYLHTQWVDAASDEILFEATTESLYDCYKELNSLSYDDDASNQVIEKRDRIQMNDDVKKVLGEIDIYERYAEQYQQLVQMMQEVLDRDGVSFDLLNMDEEDTY